MIYIIAGTDTHAKNLYIQKLVGPTASVRLSGSGVTRLALFEYASQSSLFGEMTIVSIDGFLRDGNESLLARDLDILKNSSTVFIFIEDKLLAIDKKHYAKYAQIEIFENKKEVSVPKINVFAIADAYGKKDKVGTWILYREAIDRGLEPESIAGILFWKIKTLILSSSHTFDIGALKHSSAILVSIYHEAHTGKCDFAVGLEQFILTSLS